jgi:hypothetical protein
VRTHTARPCPAARCSDRFPSRRDSGSRSRVSRPCQTFGKRRRCKLGGRNLADRHLPTHERLCAGSVELCAGSVAFKAVSGAMHMRRTDLRTAASWMASEHEVVVLPGRHELGELETAATACLLLPYRHRRSICMPGRPLEGVPKEEAFRKGRQGLWQAGSPRSAARSGSGSHRWSGRDQCMAERLRAIEAETKEVGKTRRGLGRELT